MLTNKITEIMVSWIHEDGGIDRQELIACAVAEAIILEVQDNPDWDEIYDWLLNGYEGFNEMSISRLAGEYNDIFHPEDKKELVESLNDLLNKDKL